MLVLMYEFCIGRYPSHPFYSFAVIVVTLGCYQLHLLAVVWHQEGQVKILSSITGSSSVKTLFTQRNLESGH